MDLHQYLTHKRRMCRGGQRRRYWSRSWLRPERRRQFNCCRNAFANIPCWILHAPLMSVLCSVCPLCILYAFWLSGTCSFVVCHSFGHIWLVELKPCVTYSFPVRFNRSMPDACTSVVSVFLPDWPFCHRITKILIRFTFGGSIRSSVTGALLSGEMELSIHELMIPHFG